MQPPQGSAAGLKRKSPWNTPSPAPSTPGGSGAGGMRVKLEPGGGGGVSGEVKRPRPEPSRMSTIGGPAHSTGRFADPRTAVVDLTQRLKRESTINYQLAYFHVQTLSPNLDPAQVLEMLKKAERVDFNEVNQVFSYVPELTIANKGQLRTHIRTNSTPTKGVLLRELREHLPPDWPAMMSELERKGDIIIMRALTGQFKDAPMPPLGRKNGFGLGVMDGGNGRWRTVWWDEIRERGRAGKRVDDEIIAAWADVPMAEADDVAKLLQDQELSASSAVPTPKVVAQPAGKKKKRSTRALKITNTHMKELGIDFSKDYERPS